MAATSSVDKDVEEKDKWPMTSINRNLAEMQKQMELLSQENIHVMESILRHHEVGMETIQRQTEVGMQKMRLLMSTIFQLQSEEGSGFVVAAPGVRYGEQHTLQLTDGSELVENEEYINPESQYYAYFYGRQGLFRFKIPTSRNMGIKIENVILNDPSNPLPHCMALFSHRHNHNIYMVGRQIKYQIEHSDGVYVFDPNRFQNLPIQGLALLDQPKELQDSFIPMIQPSWIQSEDQIYLISVHNHTRYKLLPFYFQSFDLTKNNFKTLEPPPFQEGRRGSVVGFFSLCGYIYLFVEKRSHTWEQFAFIFDPRSSEWKTHTLEHFEERKIPIPSSRIGDVGLSHESTDKSQILVTLNVEGPTAYRVRLCDGLLRPYSSRCLGEIFIHRKYKTDGDYAHLHDIGKGKFCVIFRSRNMPLLIYLFEINFDVEHRIQNALVNASITPSSQVLYSKKYKDPIPLWDMHFFDTLFLASSTSNEGRDMVATSSVDKDLKKNSKSKSRRHRSGGKKSNRNEGRDMAATSSGDKDEQKKDRSILGDIGGEGKNPTQGIKPRG